MAEPASRMSKKLEGGLGAAPAGSVRRAMRNSSARMGAVRPAVSRLVREFVQEIRPAQNLLVIKTAVGSAQPVAAALDDEDWPESIGTIGGDDTILIVCPSKKAASRLAARIEEMLA